MCSRYKRRAIVLPICRWIWIWWYCASYTFIFTVCICPSLFYWFCCSISVSLRRLAAGGDRGAGGGGQVKIAMSRQGRGLRRRTDGYKQYRRRAAWQRVLIKFELHPYDSKLLISCTIYHCKWYIAKTRYFGLHFYRKMFTYIFNHFYAMLPGRYRVRWNDAK